MIITRGDISAHKPLTANAPAAEIDRYIAESERMNIRPLLGELFFRDVQANLTDPDYALLLNGGAYTHGDESYEHPGIRRVAVEYAWGRYVFFGNEVSTGWGMVQKNYQDGTHADRNRLKERYRESQRIAAAMWSDVAAYLNRVGTFEKWNACRTGSLPGGFKMNHVR